jgi:uncharacterized repeat protein (TIGR01451 family)
MKRIFLTFALGLTCVSLAHATSRDSLTGTVEAFRVVTLEDGNEAFVPADKARPTDVIEYRLTYKNNGTEFVQSIFITDPIPSGTKYIEESASQPGNGSVEFSIDDGRTYQNWPIEIIEKTPDGREVIKRATPDMVTHIRWTLSDTFQPDRHIMVSYRTIIK